MGYLFDTDAIAETLKPKPADAYVSWLQTVPRQDQFTSAVVVGELFKGAYRSPASRKWVRRIEAAHEAALKLVTEATYRIWRLYMAGSAYGFVRGRLAVYQTRLVKPDRNGRAGLPLSRDDWYENAKRSDERINPVAPHGNAAIQRGP